MAVLAPRAGDGNRPALPSAWRLVRENRALTREQAELAFANLTLINFNYDRTVEQYLYWALQQYGRVPEDVAAKSVASLRSGDGCRCTILMDDRAALTGIVPSTHGMGLRVQNQRCLGEG